MSSLSSREKLGIYVITLLIIIVLGYFFGIRNLNIQYDDLVKEQKELNTRKEYLDQLRKANANTQTEIEKLKEEISKLELSFIDKLETECLEQYIMSTLEQAGSPYLKAMEASDVECEPITLADGSMSKDQLVCKRVVATYSTTDGITVAQYNRNPDFTDNFGQQKGQDIANEFAKKFKTEETATRVGYDEFINAITTISNANPNCIKVSDFSIQQATGFLTMSATIDFYGTILENRISTDTSNEPYTSWRGDTGVNTEGGIVGYPYVVQNEKSLWNGIAIHDDQVTQWIDRPFAAYWSNAQFVARINKAGSLEKFLNLKTAPANNDAANGAAGDAAAQGDAAKKAA